jgi:hypothetical protein
MAPGRSFGGSISVVWLPVTVVSLDIGFETCLRWVASLQEYPHHHEVDSRLQYDDLSRVVRPTGGDPCLVTARLELKGATEWYAST